MHSSTSRACRSGRGAERLTTGAKAIVPTPRGCAIADQVEVIAHRIRGDELTDLAAKDPKATIRAVHRICRTLDAPSGTAS